MLKANPEPLTEERFREIVREEINASFARGLEILNGDDTDTQSGPRYIGRIPTDEGD